MKIYDETIGRLVTSSVMVSMAVEVSPLNPVKTSVLRLIMFSRPIFLMTDSCRILTKMPLSTIILSTMVWASRIEINKASSWRKFTPSVSYSVKLTIGPDTTSTA
ncbi:hypothetical protein ACFX10_047133 [Malus domestica]